tara:strand:- start:879 stop:1265 length:387 start_codon:yes stop_codon:yes gene_type:complete
MSKIDTVKIQSNKTWVMLGSKNIQELTIVNRSTVATTIDFAIGPASLRNNTTDDGCVYFLKDLKIPLGASLVLDQQWFFKTFSAGMTIFTNSVSNGILTQTEMAIPQFLIRTGDADAAEAVDLIILRK